MPGFSTLGRGFREAEIGRARLMADGSSGRGSGSGSGFGRLIPQRPPGVNSQLADMTLESWQDIQDRILPIENDLVARALSDGETEADRAGDLATAGGARASETFARDLGRSGSSLSADENEAITRRRSLSTALNASGAENNSRRNHREDSTAMLSNLVGLNRQVHNSALGGLNAAAGAQSARQNANAAAQQQQQMSAIGLAGMGMSAFGSGWGALAGLAAFL